MSLIAREIEFKYNAAVSLSTFKAFCEGRKPDKFIIISGYDHFYANNDPNSFYRHRVNTNENQLTFKRKTVDDNSFIREEHNIDLPLNVSEDKIKALCGVNNYQYNTSIFKNCFIYNYNYYTLVYYVVYDIDLKEAGRFIEIEMKEDYDWNSETEAFNELLALERLCKPLGLSNEVRINKSLFEMYRR